MQVAALWENKENERTHLSPRAKEPKTEHHVDQEERDHLKARHREASAI